MADPFTRLDNWLDERLFGWDDFSPYQKTTDKDPLFLRTERLRGWLCSRWRRWLHG